jgi:hypothetical protein
MQSQLVVAVAAMESLQVQALVVVREVTQQVGLIFPIQ